MCCCVGTGPAGGGSLRYRWVNPITCERISSHHAYVSRRRRLPPLRCCNRIVRQAVGGLCPTLRACSEGNPELHAILMSPQQLAAGLGAPPGCIPTHVASTVQASLRSHHSVELFSATGRAGRRHVGECLLRAAASSLIQQSPHEQRAEAVYCTDTQQNTAHSLPDRIHLQDGNILCNS